MRKMASQRGAALLVNRFYPKLYVLMCRGILVLRPPQLPSPLFQGPMVPSYISPAQFTHVTIAEARCFHPKPCRLPFDPPFVSIRPTITLSANFLQTRIRHKIE
jgi:hypothetical protein